MSMTRNAFECSGGYCRWLTFVVILGISFLAALGVTPAAAGVIVGIAPTTPGSLPPGPFVGDSGIGTNPPNMVQITGTGTITSNPSDVWDKDIVWNYSSSSISPGDKLCINEEIQLFSSPTSTVQVTDWHERLVGGSVPLGWTLQGAGISFKVGASPFPFQNVNIGLSADRREIWFYFDPLNVGPPGNLAPITLVISKYIEYLGTSVITSGGTSAQLEVRITEQPSITPEPNAASLLIAGLSLLTFIRSANRKAT
jgi:hypothetical protein